MYAKNVGALPTAKPVKNISKLDLSKAQSLCNWYSNKLSPYNPELKEELAQHGIASFLEIYQNYNSELGYSVLTYTAPYIKGEILRYWNKLKSPVKVTQTKENLSVLYSMGNEKQKKSSSENSRFIKNAMSSIDINDLNPDKFYGNDHLSENSLVENIEKRDELKKLQNIILKVKKNLKSIDIQILESRILGDKKLKDIAKKLNISIEGVRKKETRIINLIKLEFANYANKYNEKYI